MTPEDVIQRIHDELIREDDTWGAVTLSHNGDTDGLCILLFDETLQKETALMITCGCAKDHPRFLK